MNKISLLFLTLIALQSNCQDTLIAHIPMIGNKKFILFDNGTYKYKSFLCGIGTIEYGTYEIKRKKIIFIPDTCVIPKSHSKVIDASPNDTLIIHFFDIVDSTKLQYFEFLPVKIGSVNFGGYKDSVVIDKKYLTSDIIEITTATNGIISLKIDTSAYQIHIYQLPRFFQFDCSNSFEKIVLTKNKDVFCEKIIYRRENEDKPWKKGKKRKYYECYVFTETKN